MRPSPLFILTILALLGLGLAFIQFNPHVTAPVSPANAAALGVGLAALIMIFLLVKTGSASWRDFVPYHRETRSDK